LRAVQNDTAACTVRKDTAKIHSIAYLFTFQYFHKIYLQQFTFSTSSRMYRPYRQNLSYSNYQPANLE